MKPVLRPNRESILAYVRWRQQRRLKAIRAARVGVEYRPSGDEITDSRMRYDNAKYEIPDQ